MDIYDVAHGFTIAGYVFLLLAIFFAGVTIIGLLLGSKFVWAAIAAVSCVFFRGF